MAKVRGWKKGSPEVIKRIVLVSLFVLLLSQVVCSVCYADNAEVLPKGVSGVRLNGQFYFPVDERYDPDGNKEDVAADYNTTFDSSVFDDLALLEGSPPLLPSGSANIGNSVVSLEYEWQELDFFYEYGVTERLTVGIHIPYWWNKTNVDARLDTTNATVGTNPFLGLGVLPAQLDTAPLIPIALAGVPLTTEQVQQLLGPGLDVNGDGTIDMAGFGFKRFESWSGSGLSDIELGLRYQYFKTEDWRLAFTGAVRLPTGEVDDPDNLADEAFGEGVYALLFQFQNDYIGTENLVLNGTFRYELKLPDEETLRVPDDVNRPITANKEEVDRDLGDVIELEASGTYQFSEAFSLSLLYEFEYGFKDRVTGDLGFSYESLEAETEFRSHIGIIALAYSTIPLYQKKEFPVPLDVFVKYRNRFAGKNIVQSEYISVGLSVYF